VIVINNRVYQMSDVVMLDNHLLYIKCEKRLVVDAVISYV
jgi:hypothetical protein